MPVQEIYTSLQQLSDAVATLETLVVSKEHQTKQRSSLPNQSDLFGGWTGSSDSRGNARIANDMSAILAKKLDNTIDRVQNLLKEAGA